MRISLEDIDKYESKPIQSYSIEFQKIDDYNELMKQFNRIRQTAIYQHKNKYKETAIAMCISKNVGDMCKKVWEKTENGGHKQVFVRDKDNPFYYTSLPHEVKPHIHFLSVGKGSRSLCEKIVHNENRRAKKCVAKLYSNKGHIPLGYIKLQASVYREIGDISSYVDDFEDL